MPDEFISAKPSPAVQQFFHRTLPLVLPWLGIVAVDYRPEDLALLKNLAGRRVLLTPNHPTNTEPALLFHLSGAVRQPFHFLACRELSIFWAAYGGRSSGGSGRFRSCGEPLTGRVFARPESFWPSKEQES
jgi:hypothetical protein